MKYCALLMALVMAFNCTAIPQEVRTLGMSQSDKVKAEVQRRGVGEKSQVRVILRSKAQLKGHISKIENSSFDVTTKSTGQATTISYADVERIQGLGLSTGAKVGIAIGIAVAVVVVALAVGLKSHGY